MAFSVLVRCARVRASTTRRRWTQAGWTTNTNWSLGTRPGWRQRRAQRWVFAATCTTYFIYIAQRVLFNRQHVKEKLKKIAVALAPKPRSHSSTLTYFVQYTFGFGFICTMYSWQLGADSDWAKVSILKGLLGHHLGCFWLKIADPLRSTCTLKLYQNI